MADGTLRERKKALLLEVDARLAPLWPGPTRSRRNADGIFWFVTLPGTAEAQVHLATLKVGLPVGEFAVEPTMLVRGGMLAERLARVDGPVGHVGRLGALLLSRVRDGRGMADSTAGLDRQADWVVRHVSEQFVPDMLAFSGSGRGWSAALHVAEHHPHEVDRPAHTMAILRELADTSGTTRPGA